MSPLHNTYGVKDLLSVWRSKFVKTNKLFFQN